MELFPKHFYLLQSTVNVAMKQLTAGHVEGTTNTSQNQVMHTEQFSLKCGGDRSRVYPRVLFWILYIRGAFTF